MGEGSFAQLLQSSENLKKKTCGAVADLSRRNPFYPLQENAPLLAALDLMVSNKVHRLPVVDGHGDLISIVTQSHLARMISSNSARFPIAYYHISTVKLGQKDVVSVSADTRAIDAFETIHNKKVTGVAVVDSNGKLVDNISASDLKLIGADIEMLSRVFMTVSEFLKLDGKERSLIFVNKSSTVGEVLEKLVSTKTHRVYVVDDNNKPTGVISLGDILEAVLSSVKPH
jgi:CBS domain-containing protein